MKKTVSLLVCAMSLALASSAHAAEVPVVTNVGGPEGPLFVDGMLYFAGWTSNALSRWDGIAAGMGTTNVAFGEGERELYVTVVKDPNDAKAIGQIVRIPNIR